jgi:hypothetical protein
MFDRPAVLEHAGESALPQHSRNGYSVVIETLSNRELYLTHKHYYKCFAFRRGEHIWIVITRSRVSLTR